MAFLRYLRSLHPDDLLRLILLGSVVAMLVVWAAILIAGWVVLG